MPNVLIPIPSYGFDPTEVAIPWKLLTKEKVDVVFATPSGDKAAADGLMLSGKGLGIWKSALRARYDAVTAYSEMERDVSFCCPSKYSDAREMDFDAIFLPGGHAKGIREYLESTLLQHLVAEFFAANKPVGAICHGVILVARSLNPKTGKSVIFDYKTTSLLKFQELAAYNLTRLWMKDYYLTYPDTTVEDEVKSALSDSGAFLRGPIPIFRDNLDRLGRGFVVKDRNYVSARWPGDAYSISLELVKMLREEVADQQSIRTERCAENAIS